MKSYTNKYQVKIPIKDINGKVRKVIYDSYMAGIVGALKIKKDYSLHGLVLIIGDVGSGKSSLVKGMSAFDAHLNGLQLNIDDFSWSMDKVINAMDNPDNMYRPIIADEWIQSGGTRGFALTAIGNKLKIGFVTKRLKKNTYYLLVDKIQEFPEKLIEMADCVINVKRFGLKRGYFDVYTNPNEIYFIWNGIKNMNKNWNSKEIKSIKPAHRGMFPDYENIFINEDEFNQRKIEQTRQNEEVKTDKKHIALIKSIHKLKDLGFNNSQIGDFLGVNRSTIGQWLKIVVV